MESGINKLSSINKTVRVLLALFMCLSLILGRISLFGVNRVYAGETVNLDDVWPKGPEITGDGAIVIEATSGTILYGKNIYDQFYPASTTKILTTLVALENSDLDEIVTVSYAADNYVSKTSSRMGLVEGEQLTMEQALYGIMLESANEATYAVGEHVGGSIAKFIKMMNKKAESLGCERSHFANSHGLHDDNHYTCPYDMSLIARAAYQNPEFRKINATASFAMPETNKNPAKTLTNHHWFLNKTMKYDYCIGGKTGATTQAGYSLVTYARKDGVTLISVVMHCDTWNTVYTETKTLLDYCFDNFSLYKMNDLALSAEDSFPNPFISDYGFERENGDLIYTEDGGNVILPAGISVNDTEKHVVLDNEVEIGPGENIIGQIQYTYGTRVVGAANIIYYNAKNSVTAKNFRSRWPSYMIPVETVFAAENIAAVDRKLAEEAMGTPAFTEEDRMPLMIGAAVAVVVLVAGIATLIVLRKNSRRRY